MTTLTSAVHFFQALDRSLSSRSDTAQKSLLLTPPATVFASPWKSPATSTLTTTSMLPLI